MPIYEYRCQKCGEHMEVMQKISDKPLSRHSKCGGRLTKEWSRTGFQFKGSGWYVTDYAGRKTELKEADGKEAKETKSESADSKSEEKPKESHKEAKPSKSKKSSTAKD